MMSPEKFGKILNKLPKEKVELEKVELNLVEDLRKEFGSLQTLGLDSDLLGFEKKYLEKIPKYNALEIQFQDAAQKAKELGVDKLAEEAKAFAKACVESAKQMDKKANLISQIVKI